MLACEIKAVNIGQIQELAALAKHIWLEHFPPVIGMAQTQYMINTFQSSVAIQNQMEQEGYCYYFLIVQGEKAGYTGLKKDGNTLFLSKIYVKKEFRRQHIAAAGIAFMTDLCQKEGLSKIWLTVNKHNHGPIAAYKALGFTITRSIETDIGNGFVMDDYVMEKIISPA